MRPASPIIAAVTLALALCGGAADHRASAQSADAAAFLAGQAKDCPGCNLAGASLKPVSYTHLTLPTILRV